MGFSLPLFLGMVVQSAKALEKVHIQETESAQKDFESHLTEAVMDIEEMFGPSQFGSDNPIEGSASRGTEHSVSVGSSEGHEVRRKSSLSRLQTSIRQAASSLYPRRFSGSRDT